MDSFPNTNIDLVYICVNKLTNLKMYYNYGGNNSDLSKTKSPM